MAAAWSTAHVRRLFWRAGFGATPREARRWAKAGKAATLRHVLEPERGARLVGPAARVNGKRLDPVNVWGHDVLWWLDRMVRSTHPLEERMTLFWHDHFATSDQETPFMLRQNRLFRRHALGSFPALLGDVTRDPAMLGFLSLSDSDPRAPNENYARELMELFTLGSGYSEHDIRQAAKGLTGFRSLYHDTGLPTFIYDPENHAKGMKTIFHQRGRWAWEDVLRLVVTHPRHAGFLVEQLWDYFVATPITPGTKRRLVRAYRRSGHKVKPVVAAILAHPAMYRDLDAPNMVKCPVVYVAGMLRTSGDHIRTDAWTWLMDGMGQQLFSPPSVAGWDWGTAWLSSNAMKIRHDAVNYLLDEGPVAVEDKSTPTTLSGKEAVRRAHRACGEPWMSVRGYGAAVHLARHMLSGSDRSHQYMDLQTRADQTQRALRHLMLAGPDGQVH